MRKAKIVCLQGKQALINRDKTPLTPEKLRELSGLDHLTDEEAGKIIHSIRLFAKVLYGFMRARCATGNGHTKTQHTNSNIEKNAA